MLSSVWLPKIVPAYSGNLIYLRSLRVIRFLRALRTIEVSLNNNYYYYLFYILALESNPASPDFFLPAFERRDNHVKSGLLGPRDHRTSTVRWGTKEQMYVRIIWDSG